MPSSVNPLARPGGDEVPLGQRRTPMGWLVATVTFAMFLSFALPAISDSLPQTRPVGEGERIDMVGGSIAPPAGWFVSLPDAAGGYPMFTKADVDVTVFAGLWQGDTRDLVDRVIFWMADTSGTRPVSEEQPSLSTDDREVYRVDLADSQGGDLLFVVREGAAVVVVAVRVEGEPSTYLNRDLEAMIDSLWLDETPLHWVEDTP